MITKEPKNIPHSSQSMCKGPETETSLASSIKKKKWARWPRSRERRTMRLERQAGPTHARWKQEKGPGDILTQQEGFWQGE